MRHLAMAALIGLAGALNAAAAEPPPRGILKPVTKEQKGKVVCADARKCDAPKIQDYDYNEEALDALEAAIEAKQRQLRRPLRPPELRALFVLHLQPAFDAHLERLKADGQTFTDAQRASMLDKFVDDSIAERAKPPTDPH